MKPSATSTMCGTAAIRCARALGMEGREVLAEQGPTTCARPQRPGQQAHERRLPGPVGPEDTQSLTGGTGRDEISENARHSIGVTGIHGLRERPRAGRRAPLRLGMPGLSESPGRGTARCSPPDCEPRPHWQEPGMELDKAHVGEWNRSKKQRERGRNRGAS